MARRAYADPDPESPDPAPGPDTRPDDTQQVDWLTGPEQQVAQLMEQVFVEYKKLPEVKRREARWEVNELRRHDGFTGVKLIKEDGGSWRAWVPMGATGNLELVNEARRLCRVFVGNMFADPPAPQVFPTDTGEDDRDTSDVSERALGDLQSEQRLNTPTKVRDATDTACTYGSGYVVYSIDPTGGGRIVRTQMASPLATDPAHPLIDPATGMPHAPMIPAHQDVAGPTGAFQPTAGGAPQMVPDVENAPSPVERLVHSSGKSYTADAQAAAYDWKKDIKSEVLSGRHVMLIPHTAENVWEAHGAMIATYQPWKTLKAMFPDLAKLPPEQVEALINHKPMGSENLIPKHRRGRQTVDDNALVFTLVLCYEECAEYPDGFYGIAIGGKLVPWRQPWVDYASGQREALLLPVSQVKLFRNGKSDTAGDGLMDDIGGVSEVMAAQIGHLLAYLDWFNNPTVYVPLHSTIQDQDILARKPIIRILPGGEPKMLEPPRYPQESMTVYELMRDAAQNASHLMDTAQGMEDPNVKSGRHAYQIVAQAHAQLSEPKQNIERAYVRCCQIELQYARAFQLDGDARWTGDDGVFKVKKWQGADLGGDVQLKPGTMTMLSPAAKAQLWEQWLGSGMVTPDEAREGLAQGIGAVVGLRDDPYKLEIRRQIAEWENGPPQGYQPFDPNMAIAQQAQQMNQPPEAVAAAIQMGQMQPPTDPMLEQIWQPRAHHQLPLVAQTRLVELAKLMATSRYHAMDRGWQGLVEQEFQRMMQMSMPPAPAPGPGAPGAGGQDQPPAGGGAASPGPASPGAGMPSLDNPALTGGQPQQAAA